ncbi:MAG: autophagy protein 17 [Claussenomyces sp. TS43310]|nr:MAG: autophagy protein 17 [Claussenomyces sp. TS43310]
MSTSPIPGSHSQASLTRGISPGRSSTSDDIALETLVSHLLASKRALSSINTVWRANEIVTSARSALEESVILSSRTGFLRKGISQQTKTLQKIRRDIEFAYSDTQREFEDVLHQLDSADTRLQNTMDLLRATIVETRLRPPEEQPRSLLDFVDEASVETMRTALKDIIYQAQIAIQEAQADFLSSLQSYDTDLKSVKTTLSSFPNDSPSSVSSLKRTPKKSPIPSLLHSLESHASEMANLLDSLVSHFDLCLNAIKHTEGGFAAVRDVTSANPNLPSLSGVLGSPSNSAHFKEESEPLSERDRKDMLSVLANDAAEVEDVVMELHQRLANMEEQHEQICDYVSSLTSTYTATTTAFQLLESMGMKLPGHISSRHSFILRWTECKTQLETYMEELNSMTIFYEGYLGCYDGLILEVARRKAAEEKMKGVLRKAMEQVRKIHDVDTHEREDFRKDVGDYLPSDLWPGLIANAPKWEMIVTGEDEDDKSTPELERAVVEAAARRDEERSRKG